jgi:3-methyl-2-oxobutanoate hydroxymethyltransferase
MTKKLTTRDIKLCKASRGHRLQMLTAYDFQTSSLLNETALDLILVGDSLGNVILGYETTVEVTLSDMITFGAAVKRGAPQKFVVVDMPFGSYYSVVDGMKNAVELCQQTKAEAIKIEGASPIKVELVKQLNDNGIAVMGHLGLTPQSVHQQGGYYTHGKTKETYDHILEQAKQLEQAGCFAVVLECVTKELANQITSELSIPTIGIGSGDQTDGQVLVINDLLKLGANHPPSFCQPIADLYTYKKELITNYLDNTQAKQGIHHVERPVS